MAELARRRLGRTALEVSPIGLGGGGRGQNPQIRGTPEEPETRKLAREIIHRALDGGINYFDTCTGYGESEAILGEVAAERRVEMILASKCDKPHHSRDQLLSQLDRSLERLQIERLDLWLIHNLRTSEEVEGLFKPGGAMSVFRSAREQGKTSYIGISGHSSGGVLRQALERSVTEGIDLDVVMFSFNAADAYHGGHGQAIVDNHPSIGLVAMKIFGSDGAPLLDGGLRAEDALSYVLSRPISTAVIGMHSVRDLEENLRIARAFRSCDANALSEMERHVTPKTPHVFALTA